MFKQRMLIPHQYYYPNMNFFTDRSTTEREEAFRAACKEKDPVSKATIYIHVPFCNSKCAFCSFDKEYDLDEMGAYVEKLREEIRYYSGLLKDSFEIQSVHFWRRHTCPASG